ncbi:cyclopropane-fatty-acyl-phospholipid synthase family protein [Maricaulis sp.]|uniref:SAM-dependent methyltransferase n=1 Tax=unclassified Maricaulis TaxID=2632371 RepID=UPI001B19F5FC|nr:cyclopropane-fatty-acyl-phospholipid synthase family protein [Maricaulis sp.]MBO6795556.1 class I SAM-dependent methyltransferase [Maricaulis sp.]
MDLSPSRITELSPEHTASWLDRQAAGWISKTLSRAGALNLLVELPSGYRFMAARHSATPLVEWRLNSWNVLARTLFSGPLGFAEGYVNGEWESDDLAALLTSLATGLDEMNVASAKTGPSRLLARLKHLRNANSRSGSRRNISFHYDLGNAFYEKWLDKSMTYSSALFDSHEESLETAQERKYRRICEQLQLKPGQHVLEIGCGWGGFAEIAARDFGCRVTGVTLSQEQLDFARARMQRLGLEDQVELRLQDYRDIPEQYDAIASIEMFEAVGAEHWQTYFAKLKSVLKPGGRAALQVITIRERDFDSYLKSVDFIQKYVFPGGMLPTNQHVVELGRQHGLASINTHLFGKDYAETLRRWCEVYQNEWACIEPMGFDTRFDRIWRFYLAYCEAGFETDRIDVGQFTFENK